MDAAAPGLADVNLNRRKQALENARGKRDSAHSARLISHFS
jgi:hypothetical protein